MSNLRIEGLVARARGWTEADLRKFPTATLELIDALAAALVAAWPGDAPADRLREAAEYALDYLVASNQRFNVDPTAIDKLERALAPIDAPWVAALSLHKEAQSLSNCMDCGKEYGGSEWLDLTFSKAQWLMIHPADGGVLCANCIIRRASKLPHVISIAGKITFADDYDEAAVTHKEEVDNLQLHRRMYERRLRIKDREAQPNSDDPQAISELAALHKEGAGGATVEDGFGSVWLKACPEQGCSGEMQVMRPGKVQCSHEHLHEKLRASPAGRAEQVSGSTGAAKDGDAR